MFEKLDIAEELRATRVMTGLQEESVTKRTCRVPPVWAALLFTTWSSRAAHDRNDAS